jgi:hypothetical protein
VLLWHTEEDVHEAGSRFDKLRVATFRVDEQHQMSAFIYPDLLPGPAYCWRSDHFIQAVDSLPLRPAPGAFMLANIATWVTLRLGQAVRPEVVIAALAPFVDGYALTVVQEKEGEISASKIEFAGDQFLVSPLGHEPGSFLFQVNLCSNKEAALAAAYDAVEADHRQTLESRITRTARAIGKFKPRGQASLHFFRLLASRLGGDYAYANEDVKSYFIGRISRSGLEIQLEAGPALKEDRPKLILKEKA